MKIYTASKTKHFKLWQDLRNSGLDIISTWIDEAEPGQTIDNNGLVSRCVKEASEADILLLYSEPDEVMKGALIELGAAMAANKSVVSVGRCLNFPVLFTSYSLWKEFPNLKQAVQFIQEQSL